MGQATTEDLPAFPMARACPLHAPDSYLQLQDDEPVARVRLPNGSTAWLVTKHEHVRQVLMSPHMSSDRTRPGFPALVPGVSRLKDHGVGFLSWADPPEHTTQRRMLTGEFTVRRAQEMRPAIQAIVDSCLDDLAASGQPADLVATLAMPVPALVLASLLGIPDRDLDLFRTKAIEIGHPASSPETRGAAYRTLRHYLKELVESDGPGPEPGMLTRLTERYRAAGAVDNAEVLGFANLLILAGHESSANMIALSAAALLRNRDQWDILANDPRGTRQAVEELFRYFSVSDVVTSRVATADVEVGGVTIRAGEGVIASNNAANHDPELFEDPNRLDLTRPTRRHIAFGYGAHQCLGQHITRLELELVFNSLTARFPNLRLAVPFEELEFTTDARLYGLYAMPVVW